MARILVNKKTKPTKGKKKTVKRTVDKLAGKGSLADKVKDNRTRKQKRLDEIMGKNKKKGS